MPITMGGMSSGIDTNEVIKKLVELEAKPIEKLIESKKNSEVRKNALSLLRTRLEELNNSAKNLYGHRATYNERTVVSSDPGTIQAIATKNAEKGTREIIVTQLASNHKISSDPVAKDKILQSCKFNISVNGESKSIKFKGGTIESLKQKIAESASDLLTASTVNSSENESVLILESKFEGSKGAIVISGDKDSLKDIGLIKGETEAGKDKVAVVFDKKYITSYTGDKKIEKEDGVFDVGADGKSLKIKGALWREYLLPVEAPVKKDTILDVNIDYSNKADGVEESQSNSIELGPEERIVIKGIDLKGYNVLRERPFEKKEEKKELKEVTGIGVVSVANGIRTEKIYELDKTVKGKQTLPIGTDFDGKNVSKIIFYCNEGTAGFSDVVMLTPLKEAGTLEPKNIIKEAADAKLKMDGIELKRNKNNDISDVIKGVSLNLKRASAVPVVITIDQDINKGADSIKRFIKAYNDYLDLHRELTKTAKTEKVGEYKKTKYDNGPFVGDMTILRLENSLKTTIGSAYPSMAEDPIKILVQLGISTGEINAEWQSIKEGKLVVNEEKLIDNLTRNPEGVQEFFGSDTDGDNRVDNGLAYMVEYHLKPYLMSGKSIIATQIDLENNAIKSADERIEKQEEHLKKYEDKLRQKFSAMEQSISGAKSQGNWMKSNMNSGGSGDEK